MIDAMEIKGSARKHGLTDAEIHHAVDNAMIIHRMDGYIVVVGPTPTGRLIEVGINQKNQAFHAMDARKKFLP